MRRIASVALALLLLLGIAGVASATDILKGIECRGSAQYSESTDSPILQATSYTQINERFSFSAKWYYYPSGKPAANLYVTLQRSKDGGAWSTISSGRTNSLGYVYFTRSESSAGTYRYRSVAGSTISSNLLTVYVRSGTPTITRVADFTASPTSGAPTLLVRFTDKSTLTPATWKWEFGDGTTSTARNPSHSYTRAGTFTVKLTVKYANGQVLTKTRSGYIRVVS